MPDTAEARTTYDLLIDLLARGGATYRLIEHEPEGVTALASAARGHDLEQAAKCIVVRVKLGKRTNRFILAVVPGDRLVALDVLREMWGGTYVSFATRETAEELSGCVSGTIIPFTFRPDLELVVDSGLLRQPEIYFNAARLDVSVALDTRDYVRIAEPRVESIARPAELAEAS